MKIILLGAPGSGKGTYSRRLSPKLGIPAVSVGEALRKTRDDPELGPIIKDCQDRGVLCPDELTVNVLKKRLEDPDCEKGFMLDGYPRNLHQAEAIDGEIPIDVVLKLNVPEEILIQKISARRSCKECGDIYNLADIRLGDLHLPPMNPKVEGKCDKCGGELVQRPDDAEEVVRDRMVVYKKETAPLIDFYNKKGLIMDVVVSAGPDIMTEKIMGQLKEKFGDMIA